MPPVSVEVGEGENPVELGATSNPKSNGRAADPKSKPDGQPDSPGRRGKTRLPPSPLYTCTPETTSSTSTNSNSEQIQISLS